MVALGLTSAHDAAWRVRSSGASDERKTDRIAVLLVDDDPDEGLLIERALARAEIGEFRLDQVTTVEDGIVAARESRHDVYLVDYRLGRSSGLEFIERAKEVGAGPFLLLTGFGDADVDIAAMLAGASDYLAKQKLEPDRLSRAIRYAIAEKQASTALRASEQRYRELFEGVPVGVIRSRPNGEVLDANPAALEIFGFGDLASVRKTRTTDRYANPEDREEVIRLAQAEGVVSGREVEMLRVDDRPIWVRVAVHAVRDHSGRVVGYDSIVEDVTQHRKTQLQRDLLLELTIAIVQSKDVEEALRQVLEMLGGRAARWKCAEAWTPTGRGLTRAVTWSSDARFEGFLQRWDGAFRAGDGIPGLTFEHGESVIVRDLTTDARFHRQDLAVEHQLRAAVAVPVTVHEETLAVLMFFDSEDLEDDDTDLVLVTTVASQLGLAIGAIESLQRLKQLSNAKDEFIAAVSHALRTPLTAVTGFLDVVLEDSHRLPADHEDLLTTASREARNLAHLIDNLLVAARSDISGVFVQFEALAISEEVDRVLGELEVGEAERVDRRGHGAIAAGDRARVRLIIRNLIQNALHYSEGDVLVETGEAGGRVTVAVSTPGPAIPEADVEAIFEPYVSLAVDPGRPGPLGLGLPVSRTLARLMRGELQYEYRTGRNVFELSLPIWDG